jgi:hypothetical protein
VSVESGTPNNRKATAQERMLDGYLSGEEYVETSRKLSTEIAESQEQLDCATGESLDVEAAIGHMGFVLWNVRHVYETHDLRGKQRLHARLFPNGLPITKNGFWNVATHSLYVLLADDSVPDAEVVRPSIASLNSLVQILRKAQPLYRECAAILRQAGISVGSGR